MTATRAELEATVTKLRERLKNTPRVVWIIELTFQDAPLSMALKGAYYEREDAIDAVTRHACHLLDRPDAMSSDVAAIALRKNGWLDLPARFYRLKPVNLS